MSPSPVFQLNEFAECSECRAKPGSPTLCPACCHNRTQIMGLWKRVQELESKLTRTLRFIEEHARVPDADEYHYSACLGCGRFWGRNGRPIPAAIEHAHDCVLVALLGIEPRHGVAP